MIIFRIVSENDENRNSSYFFNDHLSNFHQIANRNLENYQQHCKQKHMAYFFSGACQKFLCLCANSLHIHLHLRGPVPVKGYSKHYAVVSEVTNLATIYICIWYVITFSESQCKICSKQMQHILLLTPLPIVAVSIVFPAKSLTAH